LDKGSALGFSFLVGRGADLGLLVAVHLLISIQLAQSTTLFAF
jgi:hypothetical protein